MDLVTLGLLALGIMALSKGKDEEPVNDPKLLAAGVTGKMLYQFSNSIYGQVNPSTGSPWTDDQILRSTGWSQLQLDAMREHFDILPAAPVIEQTIEPALPPIEETIQPAAPVEEVIQPAPPASEEPMDLLTLGLLAAGASIIFKNEQPLEEPVIPDPGADVPIAADPVLNAIVEPPPVAVNPDLNLQALNTGSWGNTGVPLTNFMLPEPYDAAGVEAGTAAYSEEHLKMAVQAGAYDKSVLDHYWHWMQVWVNRRMTPGTMYYSPTSYDPWGGPDAYLANVKSRLRI